MSEELKDLWWVTVLLAKANHKRGIGGFPQINIFDDNGIYLDYETGSFSGNLKELAAFLEGFLVAEGDLP